MKNIGKEITYRTAKKSDIPQLVALMNSQYARKKNNEYFEWQFFASHPKSIIICAFFGNDLIGMFGMQKKKLNNGAHVGLLLDLLVTKEWRKKGIFKNLGKIALKNWDNIDLYCVLPNLNGKNACEKTFNFKTIAKINDLTLAPKNYINCNEIKQKKDNKKFIQFYKNNKYLNWRFDKHPNYKYTKISIDNNNFTITKIFKDPETLKCYGDIVDIKYRTNDKINKLFSKSIKILSEKKIENITTWALPHTNLYKHLLSLGFQEEQKERYFCVKIINPKYKNLYNINNWHLAQADTEIY